METQNVEHINYNCPAKTHTPMYLMHKYWARKPANVVAEYIKHYSKEGEIVLDPFAGSGISAIESIKLGRKSIAIDLDPMATFITKNTAMPIDIKKFENTFNEIKNKIKGKIDELYITSCSKCKKEVTIEAVIWKKNSPIDIRYNCDCSKATQWKEPDKRDKEVLSEIEKKRIPYWIPQNELIWNSRINVHKGEKVSDLFTRRNLITLSIILNEINKIEDKKIKEIMRFTFSSALAQASKMVFVIRKRGRSSGSVEESAPEVGSWATRGYWIPEEFFEINAWNCFEERFNKIKRGKEESNSLIKEYKEAENFEELKKDVNIMVKTFNILELDKIIPSNSVDYIFTDPPYGDAVPYLELDYMWSSWLDFKPNFEDEIIISDSPIRNKKEETYETMLKAAFRQIYNVLKRGRWMTVTFHNTNIKVWNAIISACILAGFDLEKIIYQEPARPSAKGLLAQYGSAIGDYYIRFRKPKIDKRKKEIGINEERYKRTVLESAKKIIAERGEPTPYTYILNGIIVELKKEGALLTGEKNPDDVMREFLNKEFTLVDIKNEKGKIIGKKWWFKDPSKIPYLELVPLSDRVETAVIDVLRRKFKISFDDILQEVFIKFKNALTPERQSIKEILEEYAEPTKDGKWMLKPEVKIRESEHIKMIYCLALLGKKLRYDVWVGLREQSEVYNKVKLFELITDKDPVFRFIPTTNLDRIKQIDVLWHDEGRVKYEFEVENTTAITEAIIRGSNIPHDSIRRVIVIPEEREKLLFRKMKDPILNENISKYRWKFIFYKDVEELFNQTKTKKGIEKEDIDKLLKLPREERENQNSLKIYL